MPDQNADSNPSRVSWIQEAGKELLWLDLSHATAIESLAALGDFERALDGRPQGSVLLLVGLTQVHYSPSVSARWKAAAKAAEASHLRASAVYGASGIVGVALRGYLEALRLVGNPRNVNVFKAKAEAAAWLAQR